MATGRPSMVHILEDVEWTDAGASTARRGRLEAGPNFLEFQAPGVTLRMSPVRDITVSEGRVVVAYGEPGSSATLADAGERSASGDDRAGALAWRLREIVGLPPPPAAGPQRVAGKAWGCTGTGLAGGFLLGGALGGGVPGFVEQMEYLWGGGTLVLGSAAFAYLMGRRARVPALARWSMAAGAISAGVLLGLAGAGELADPGPDDPHQLFGSPPAIAGEVLLGFAVIVATALTFRRFAPVAGTLASRRQPVRLRTVALAAALVVGVVTAGIVAYVVAGPRLTTVATTVRDFSITLAPANAAAGEVTFDVTNQGPSAHQFWVYETDLAPEALPADPTGLGRVNEFGPGYNALLFTFDDIASGERRSFELDLDAGRYVIICNIPGHYVRGMHAAFTVS
ncbi:MAG: hypothetical protein WD770_11270 [Actinomycetota bacterium]